MTFLTLIFPKSRFMIKPIKMPLPIPNKIDVGILKKFITSILPDVAKEVKDENSTITNTSSTDAPAIINCGIPSFVPYPSSINFNILGTTTAGETAANTDPKISESSVDK